MRGPQAPEPPDTSPQGPSSRIEPRCPGCGVKPSWHFDQWAFSHAADCTARHTCSIRDCEADGWRRLDHPNPLYLCREHTTLMVSDYHYWRPEPACAHDRPGESLDDVVVNAHDINFYGDVFMCARCGRFYRAPSEGDDDDESFADVDTTRSEEQLEAMGMEELADWVFRCAIAYSVSIVYHDHIIGAAETKARDIDGEEACDHWHDELICAGAHFAAERIRQQEEN